MTMPVDRERDRRSLQDLAKMAQMTPPPASVSSNVSGVQRSAPTSEPAKDDSGIVDLAAAKAADPEAPKRAETTALASQGLFDDEPNSVRPPAIAEQPVPSIPPASAVPASLIPAAAVEAPRAIASESSKKKSGSLALLLVGFVAVSAAAAGGFFVIKGQKTPAAETVALNTPPTTESPRAEATNTPKPVAAEPAAADPVAAAPAEHAEQAKIAANGSKTSKPVVASAKAGKPAPAAEAKDEPAKLTQKDLPKSDGPPGDLGKAMQKEVGEKSGEPIPAAGTTGPQAAAGSVPQKPSQGAVTGAINAVLASARECLGPDDPISRATITFASAGTVQGVSVSGGAAGKPAEACIKGALGKAKVAPFAEPTYSANVTVRHN